MKQEKKKIKIMCVYAISMYHYEYKGYYENPYEEGTYSWKWFSGFDGNGRILCASNIFNYAIRYNSLYHAKKQLETFLANGIKAVIIEIPKEIMNDEALERRQY